jgi:hypothetical protein
MTEWRLYKTAHCKYRERPYPLAPQVMNGTGALRQLVPRSLGIDPGRPCVIQHVDLVREIPEAMKLRAIPIASSSKAEVKPIEVAA